MKLKMIIALGLALSLTSTLSAKVYSPQQGVVCDTKAGFCSDAYGISIAITEDILGAKAGKKISKMINGPYFDSSSFTMSNGLSCDAHRKVCKKSKWDNHADAHWTSVLFGNSGGGHASQGKNNFIKTAKKDCKDYITEKYNDTPRSAIHVYGGKHHGSTTSVSVHIKSSHPFIDEKGICKTIDGDVSYRRYN